MNQDLIALGSDVHVHFDIEIDGVESCISSGHSEVGQVSTLFQPTLYQPIFPRRLSTIAGDQRHPSVLLTMVPEDALDSASLEITSSQHNGNVTLWTERSSKVSGDARD